MSSEDKSLDTSDKGPSPPPGSTGATPTGSPAPIDRRPRGRPRKDAVSTAPLSVPSTKPKKKSRSRGRAVLEDDEVVETTESAEPTASQEIEPKEQQEMGEGAMLAAGDREGEGEGEGEDSPALPLNQTQEEAAAPSASASGLTKSSEQLCAFCYCGGRSLLGQGDLRTFEATPTPSSQSGGSTRTGSGDSGGDPDSGVPRPSGAPRALSSAEEGTGRFWDELSHVGLPDGTDVQTLFDESGEQAPLH